MPNLLQSSQSQATQAPNFYTDYLANLASAGTGAATGAQYVGAQPLQEQAFQQVQNVPQTYQPTLSAAGQTLGEAVQAVSPLQAGTQYLTEAAQSPALRAAGYMSPYMSNVVNAIGDVGQRNIQQNLAPLSTSAAVGSGQFGSQRGAQVLGQTLANAERDILNQQYQALNQGYNQALQAAVQQNQLLGQLGATAGTQASAGQQNLTQAGQAQTSLAGQQQGLSLADINALATLGGQQQTIAQNRQLFPLTNLSTLSSLLRGYSIPTTTTTTAQASPLSLVAGALTGTANMFTPIAGQGTATPFSNLVGGLKGAYNYITGNTSSGLSPVVTGPDGTTYTQGADGTLIPTGSQGNQDEYVPGYSPNADLVTGMEP